MSLPELLEESTKWLGWSSLVLFLITLISFFVGWGQRFRLFGATAFTILLAGSTWAFATSYTAPVVIEGAVYVPTVYDNGSDLVVAQAPKDFPKDSVRPTLEQLAGNIKSGGRRGPIHVRLRAIESEGEGISRPVILGEVIRDLSKSSTVLIEESNNES